MIYKGFLLLFASGLTTQAYAQLYAGTSIGASYVDVDQLEREYQRDIFPTRRIASSYSSQKVGAWRLQVGWQFTPVFALEFSYSDYGKQRFGYEGFREPPAGTPFFSLLENRDASREVSAWGVDIVASWPLNESIELQAGIGAANTRVDLETYVVRAVGTRGPIVDGIRKGHDYSTRPRAMAGAAWNFATNYSLSLTYEYLYDPGSDFDSTLRPALADTNNTGSTAHHTAWLQFRRSF